jgi:gliding motility-associated-like protein
VSVISNTFGPKLDSLLVPRNVLDCFVSSTTLKGISTTENVGYNWSFPGLPGNQAGDTLRVNAHFSAPTATVVDNYTLTITDNNNKCITRTVVPIYQNLFVPKAVISNGGVGALSCNTSTIMLSNMSSTGIQGSVFPSNGQVIGLLWEGPSPQEPLQVSSNYLASQVGTYSMTAMDLNNGCTSRTIIEITDNRLYPVVNKPNAPPQSILDCGTNGATLTAIITSSTTGLSYLWIAPEGAITTPKDKMPLITDMPGNYRLITTNTVNGCATGVDMTVMVGTLTTNFVMDKEKGYAPLTVTFTNTTASTLGSGSVTSVWSFGNGTSSVTTKEKEATTVYELPGTYTVTLYSGKGTCIDSTKREIKVDVHSELVVPNAFTPNDDNVNDLFFLKTTNLSEVTFFISDRWGHMVFELTSNTGNIAWDGKNQLGTNVAEGTYYYFLKATGKDGQPYEKKGTISLFR